MRLFIKPETSREDALALLDGMRAWIARSKEWSMFKPDGLPGKGYGLYSPTETANGADAGENNLMPDDLPF
jgi:hypothetical protein